MLFDWINQVLFLKGFYAAFLQRKYLQFVVLNTQVSVLDVELSV